MDFYKYHGTGNDFILVDNRNNKFPESYPGHLIKEICSRHFGIGGDGLILLETITGYDFRMRYFNADGSEGSMCGNGGRCLVHFAHFLGIVREKASFLAIDGPHQATILDHGWISLKLADVECISMHGEDYLVDTGSPHLVRFVQALDDIDVFKTGRDIRYSKAFGKEGINVNFVQDMHTHLKISTYERGVENVTLSCGTGATACALAHVMKVGIDRKITRVKTLGGDLQITYAGRDSNGFREIFLQGPATRVYHGVIEI
jgi:diaminopimelate epimerase